MGTTMDVAASFGAPEIAFASLAFLGYVASLEASRIRQLMQSIAR